MSRSNVQEREIHAAYAAAVTVPSQLRPDLSRPAAKLVREYAKALADRGASDRIVRQSTSLLLMRLAWDELDECPSLAEVLAAHDPYGWPFADRQRRLEAWADYNPASTEPPEGYILASILLDVRLSEDDRDVLRALASGLDIEAPGWRYRGKAIGIAARINEARQALGEGSRLPDTAAPPPLTGDHGPLDRECFTIRPMTFREREIIIPTGAIFGEVIEPWQRSEIFAPMDSRKIVREAAPA